MDVYLVPIGAEEYELYCEDADSPPDPSFETSARPSTAEPPSRSYAPWTLVARFFRRVRHRFSEMLSEAERERRQGYPEAEPAGWSGRLKARGRRWIAESIAEQRLLWHLRKQETACFYYPDDLEERRAAEILRRKLIRDFDKHRFWLIVDSLAFVSSAALAILPGPNVVAYYFGFRMVGHYFSLRGARQGLRAVTWTHERSAPLSDLRRAITLEPEQRERQVQDVALALELEHLVTFFERTVTLS